MKHHQAYKCAYNKNPEREKKGVEKVFEEIMVKIFPDWKKNIVDIPKGQQIPSRINSEIYIIAKLSKVKEKETILKATRKNQVIRYSTWNLQKDQQLTSR